MKSIALLSLVLTTSSAMAACPSGYQAKEIYESREVQMRFQDGGEFGRCLNQDHPEMNNHRDEWGISYGGATYKCGNVTVLGYLGNLCCDLKVMSSVGFVEFDPYTYINKSPRQNRREERAGLWDVENRNFCKGNTCFEEQSYVHEKIHYDTRTIIEVKHIFRNVFEGCAQVRF